MRLYVSREDDPFFHLAVEEWLLRELPAGEEAWFLYRNRPCVVVGRFQNPWKECDLGWMGEQGYPLVRRPSGGGTVWHDPGNVNFCRVGPLKGFHKDLALLEVQKRLAGFGVRVEINVRHDLVVAMEDGSTRKVSGSAYKQTKDRALHHGTLLIAGDLDRLERSLASPVVLAETRSIPSVRSKVMNLGNGKLTPESWMASWGEAEVVSPSDTRFDQQAWSRWEWVYGETPFFRWEFRVGEEDVRLSSHKGMIREFAWREMRTQDLNRPLRAETFGALDPTNFSNWEKLLGKTLNASSPPQRR